MMKFADELDVGYGDLDGKTLKLENIEPYFHMLEKLNLMENTDKNSGRLGPLCLQLDFII